MSYQSNQLCVATLTNTRLALLFAKPIKFLTNSELLVFLVAAKVSKNL